MVAALESGDPLTIGPYRLVGRLGSGGMGQVFLGRSPGGRQLAIKVIRSDLAGQPEFRMRFAQEVTAARAVSGLFTAPVVDADLDAQSPWLATAYVPGPSLADAVARQGPLPVPSLLALAAGLAEGLAAIHAAGIVHRDLKPSNVLLAQDGPRVIDFGISRAATAMPLTGTGMIIGSPGFMSPEQAQGLGVGPPSDVFSLGAVLAFAATGEGPFGRGSNATLLYRVVHASPAMSGVPAPMRSLVERCLAKEPAQRPTTAWLLSSLDTQPQSGWLARPADSEPPPPVPPGSGSLPTATRDAARAPQGHSAQQPPAQTEAMPMDAFPTARNVPGPGGRQHAGLALVIAAIAGAAGIAAAAVILANGGGQPHPSVNPPAASLRASAGPGGSAPARVTTPAHGTPTASTVATATAPTSSATSTAAPTYFWAAAVLSAVRLSNAQAMVARLHNAGFDGEYWRSTAANSVLPGYWVVTSGRFPDRADAVARAQQLRAAGFTGAYARCVGSRQACPAAS